MEPVQTDEPHDPCELYPLIARTAAEAGWNDPMMDDYDRYDELMESNAVRSEDATHPTAMTN